MRGRKRADRGGKRVDQLGGEEVGRV